MSLILVVAEYANIKKKKKGGGGGLLAQTWNKASAFVYLMDERFSLRALEMSYWSHNLCSLHSLALTSPQLISYAHDFFIPNEKCISPPADLHASARSKESAWEGNLRKSAVKQWLHEFYQGTESWDSNAKHHATRSRGSRVLGPLHHEHRFSAADCLK